MSRHRDVSSALTLLVLLTGMSFLLLSAAIPIGTPGDADDPHRATPPGPVVSGDVEKRDEEGELIKKESKAVEEEQEEGTDELFKDVDPKTLAAVLLEALNWSQAERRREEERYDGRNEDIKDAREETKTEEESREERMTEGEERDRDGRQELDLLMAAQGKEQEKKEAEERQRVQEEEEKLTEKVTSHTTSQTIQTEKEQQPMTAGGREEAAGSLHQGTQNSNEEEEQLSPEELKSLETVMKEFPSLSTMSKRERDSEQNQRSSRDYSAYNDVLLQDKGNNLAMSKKKLKWQEETQKALNFPSFLGGNFMDEFEDSRYAGSNAVQQPPPEKDGIDGNEEEEEEEELSPEEEEAQAKAEQEEMRRQAAEAQRAKLEEEKLADIASDMLLRYMVKQNNGDKKYGSTLSNAAEDKRSDEEQEVTEEDIDPQTIDKLIEISSKLHLPADDVVDIISDVEKKKKKDIPSEIIPHWQQPIMPLSSPSLLSTNGFSVSQSSNSQNSFPVFKQPSPAANVLKTWFQDKSPVKSQDHWFKPMKPLSANQNLWFKPRKPLSIKQELFFNSPKSVWTSYPPYFHYRSYYQKKPNRDYYPFYFPPPPRQRPRYYLPKPGLALNNYLDSSMDDPYTFPSKRRFYNWVQPRLRKPPSDVQQKSYYTSYSLPLYPQTFQPVPLLKARSPPRMALLPAQQKQFYYSPAAPSVNKNGDYYGTMVGNKLDNTNRDDLKKYIQQILKKQPQMFE